MITHSHHIVDMIWDLEQLLRHFLNDLDPLLRIGDVIALSGNKHWYNVWWWWSEKVIDTTNLGDFLMQLLNQLIGVFNVCNLMIEATDDYYI